MNTIIDVMYSKLELSLTSSFSMHSTAEILFDGVDLIYSFSIIYLLYYYYFKRNKNRKKFANLKIPAQKYVTEYHITNIHIKQISLQ
jgi:hypothetical protein